jgi:ubiquinone/menaquinone biosynthesis C-methylase UbiE
MAALWIVAIGVALLAFAVGWAVLRRKSFPCPPAFVWLLENRIMEHVAGSAVIIRRARIARGMRVLDAGCGPGRITIPLAKHLGPEGEVVALDVQPAMLDRLTDRLAQHKLGNVKVVLGGLGQGMLGKNEFDRAILITVLGEVPDRPAALREIYTGLKPGGILSVTEVLPDPHYQSRGSVRRLAKTAGFEVEEVFVGWRAYTLNLIRP